MALVTNNSYSRFPKDYVNKLKGEGYRIVWDYSVYDPFTPRIGLFYHKELVFESDKPEEVIEFQKKHLKMIDLIMPEDEDESTS